MDDLWRFTTMRVVGDVPNGVMREHLNSVRGRLNQSVVTQRRSTDNVVVPRSVGPACHAEQADGSVASACSPIQPHTRKALLFDLAERTSLCWFKADELAWPPGAAVGVGGRVCGGCGAAQRGASELGSVGCWSLGWQLARPAGSGIRIGPCL